MKILHRSRLWLFETRKTRMLWMRDLRSRLLASHLLVILVTMGVLSFLFLSLGQRYFLDALENSLAAQAQVILQTLIPQGSFIQVQENIPSPLSASNTMQQVQNLPIQIETGPSNNLEVNTASTLNQLQDLSLNITPLIQTHIRIADSAGTVVLDTGPGDVLMPEDTLNLALADGRATRTIDASGTDWFYLSLAFQMQGQTAGVIDIGQPLGDVQAVLADLRLRLMVSAVVGMILAAGTALLLASRISQPIRQLTTASRALSQGDYSAPLQMPHRDEIGELTKSFAKMRTRIQHEQDIRERFVSNVSHEMRTPLTAIKGLAETLQDGAVHDPPARDRFLATIENETDRLIRLTNDLLTLSRADSGELHLDFHPLAVEDIVDDVLALYEPHARQKDIALALNLPAEPGIVLADYDRIQQVLIILLDNALKHSPPGGTITLSAGSSRELQIAPSGDLPGSASSVFFHVHDSGTGILPEALPHVFDRFFREESSRARRSGGSGLGLSIARSLILAHNGVIWLQSPGLPPGQLPEFPGTSAFFSLPSISVS